MNKQIFKVCPTLGMYHQAAHPYVRSMDEYRKLYKEHKEAIDRETIIYGNINHDRKQFGGNKKIHNI